MTRVEYHYPHMISASFEIPTESARRLIPRGIEPVEPWHGAGVLTVTLFEFDESPVGPYQEVVLSVFVVPRLFKGDLFPHAAVAPIRLGSTHYAARQHAIDLWHLPHFYEDIRIEFQPSADGRRMTGRVFCPRGEEILELNVAHSGAWGSVCQQYQSFQADATGLYMSKIDWTGVLSEHDEGEGRVHLRDHRFFDGIPVTLAVDSPPIREMWMKQGLESIHNPCRRLSS
jgi:hypothetical protein